MARHIWTILCRRASIDSRTGSTSLFDVVEGLELETPPSRRGKTAVVPVDMQLVTTVVRSDPNVPEDLQGRSVLVLPNKKRLTANSFRIDLTTSFGSESTLAITGIPIDGAGFYEIVVELQDGPKKSWRAVSSTPLMIELSSSEISGKDKKPATKKVSG